MSKGEVTVDSLTDERRRYLNRTFVFIRIYEPGEVLQITR